MPPHGEWGQVVPYPMRSTYTACEVLQEGDTCLVRVLSPTAPNLALEPTPNSDRFCVAPASSGA
jgi:hypothetical protein